MVPVQTHLQFWGYHPAFPTEQHERAAEAVADWAAQQERVQALLLTASCARGQAAPASCVDLALLVDEADSAAFALDGDTPLARFLRSDSACLALQASVPWSGIDIEITTGCFAEPYHGWTSGPDAFELEIGNLPAWSHALVQRGPRLAELRAAFLPYYDEERAERRRQMICTLAANNLDHVLPYAERDLGFQALQRLAHATQEYLQALFIARRIYPIAYDKWMRVQVVDILGRPDIYADLVRIMTPGGLSPAALAPGVERLRRLLDELDR